jgi:6,7-dimethyl-8-ribityllumazine synthase
MIDNSKKENVMPDGQSMKFGIVLAEWNSSVTEALLSGAINTLKECKVKEENIVVKYVPGSIELTAGAKLFAEHTDVDAVISIGCVVEGETKHFDYVCESVVHGITELNLRFSIPFIFCVLTTHTLQQALDRAGGKHGNKGNECALTAVRMVELKRSF